MPNIFIQTDIFSLVGLSLTFLGLGFAISWFIFRRRRPGHISVQTGVQDEFYLIFSRLSHRLKTVGEVIRGHLHGFSDEPPKDAERWRVARRAITEEVSGVDGLVNRLDLVVRLGMVEQPLVMEPVNVPRLLEDLMVELGPAADAKGIMLGGIVSSDVQGMTHISADQMALKEVFSNLLENAVKHNDPGTEIKGEVTQRKNRLLVSISDNGKGVPQEALESIFDKGSRNYRPGAGVGTGMGLYLCKLLIELHGGEITASSEDGKGTEFRISLPLRRTG